MKPFEPIEVDDISKVIVVNQNQGGLNFSYDKQNDILEIEGIRYMGDIFRKFGGFEITPKDKCLKIISRLDGVITLMIQDHPDTLIPHKDAP